MKRILITGASGFIGSFLVEEALSRGMETWAAVRPSSKRKYLQDERIHFIEPDYHYPDRLRTQLAAVKAASGKFDYVVHCAGTTKCADDRQFDKVNFGQTKLLADTLRELDMVPRQFVFISTLSVFGPVHEQDGAPIADSDTPAPNTAYGRSKLKAERYLQSLADFPYLIFRPTGVYGPRETDYFLMAKSIRSHIDFAAGFRRQNLTFVYVKDVVQAVFRGIEKGVTHKAYFLSDGETHTSRAFSRLIQKELGVRFVLPLTCPLWVLWLVSQATGFVAALQKKASTLNPDKYKIMKQRNWRCDIGPAMNELGYRPEYNLERGVRETIAWYKEQHWL